MKIVLIINSLSGGGAERIFCQMVTELRKRTDFDLEVVLLDNLTQDYKIPDDINVHVLNSQYKLTRSIYQLTKILLRLKPTLTISFLTRSNVASIVAAKLLRHNCVISERVNTMSHLGTSKKSVLVKLIVRLIYPRANRIIAVSNGVKNDLINYFGVKQSKLQVIYNWYNVQYLRMKSSEPIDYRTPDNFILAVGRLVENKNFELLLRAYKEAHTEYNLVILGDGELRTELVELASDLEIKNKVHFIGFVENPYPFYANAKFYISTSNAEGFPNSIAEALALGCPVIATNCPSGPSEILDEQELWDQSGFYPAKYGILIPMNSKSALLKSIQQMERQNVRDYYSAMGQERIKSFTIEIAMKRYIKLINSLV